MSELQNRQKRAAAQAAAKEVHDGMTVGLGSGSTASIAVEILGARVRAGLRIVGVPTSKATEEQALRESIPLSTLEEHTSLDLTIDGADEVESGTLGLIKGLGGALLREKLVASASERLVIVVDAGKVVTRLGSKSALPVEVVPFGWKTTLRKLQELGAVPKRRLNADGQPFVSDGGHYILDCAFDAELSTEILGRELDHIVGVVEHGLFLGMSPTVYVGTDDGAEVLNR